MTGTVTRDRAAAPIEPRLRARRIEVARDQGRRRLRRILSGVAVVVLLIALVAASRSPLLDVDRIEVTGAAAARPADVRTASGIARGAAMVEVDPSAAAAGVESLPWVAEATVSRSWPGTVRIAVLERVPVAVAGTGARAVVVDAEGRALAEASGAVGDGLPVIDGSAVEVGERLSTRRRRALAVVAGLPEDLRPEVASARTTDAGVELTLVDEIVVRWGDTSQPTAKADSLRVLLAEAGRDDLDVVDVSVPRSATVTRQNGGEN